MANSAIHVCLHVAAFCVLVVAAVLVRYPSLFREHITDQTLLADNLRVETPSTRNRLRIGLQWQLHPLTGWGQFGIHALQAFGGNAEYDVTLLREPHALATDPSYSVHSSVVSSTPTRFHEPSEITPVLLPYLVMSGGGKGPGIQFWGRTNVLFSFFESTFVPATDIHGYRLYDLVVVGSTWNAQILRSVYGLQNVALLFQGVDTHLYRPIPRRRLPLPPSTSPQAHPHTASPYPLPRIDGSESVKRVVRQLNGSFVIFSAGKLELRKGQDVFIDAVRRFIAAHPHVPVRLVLLWYNMWPQIVEEMRRSPYVSTAPTFDTESRMYNFAEWLYSLGLPEGSVVDLGLRSQQDIAYMLRRSHVAVFPNRCEGGTNLLAMEAMHTATPTIISSNTGHWDLIEPPARGGTFSNNHSVSNDNIDNDDRRGDDSGKGNDVSDVGCAQHVFTVRSTVSDFPKAGCHEPDSVHLSEMIEAVYQDFPRALKVGRCGHRMIRSHFSWQRTQTELREMVRFLSDNELTQHGRKHY